MPLNLDKIRELLEKKPSREEEEDKFPEDGLAYPMLVSIGDDGDGYILSVPEAFDHEWLIDGRQTEYNGFDELPAEPGIYMCYVELHTDHGDPEEGPQPIVYLRDAILLFDTSEAQKTVEEGKGIKLVNKRP